MAVIIAIGGTTEGRRDVPGLDAGGSNAELIGAGLLCELTRRGLRCVKQLIPDAHEGIEAAVSWVLSTIWQRCCVHFQRNVPPCQNEHVIGPPEWSGSKVRA